MVQFMHDFATKRNPYWWAALFIRFMYLTMPYHS